MGRGASMIRNLSGVFLSVMRVGLEPIMMLVPDDDADVAADFADSFFMLRIHCTVCTVYVSVSNSVSITIFDFHSLCELCFLCLNFFR